MRRRSRWRWLICRWLNELNRLNELNKLNEDTKRSPDYSRENIRACSHLPRADLQRGVQPAGLGRTRLESMAAGDNVAKAGAPDAPSRTARPGSACRRRHYRPAAYHFSERLGGATERDRAGYSADSRSAG